MIHTVVFDLGKLYPWPHQHGEHFKPEDTTGALYQRPNMAWMAAIALMDKQPYEESLTKEQLEKKPFLKNSGKWRLRELKEEAERALYGRNIITMNEADHASFFGDNAGDSDSHFDDGYPPWPRYRYIRPIQVSVTDDIGRKWYMNIAAGHRYRTYQDEVERFRAIHADTHEELWHDIWTDMFNDLYTLPGLRNLEINLDQANCYHGCRRLAVAASLSIS